MEYLSVPEAVDREGLRVVLTAGLPGPWGEALKSILDFKQLDYLPVAQHAGAENTELVNWTGQASAPVCVYNDEPPRVSWLDQLLLCERLAPERPLLPADFELRALTVGLCREVAGENGLGWQRRLELLGPGINSAGANEGSRRMAARYGWSEEAHAAAPGQLVSLLRGFRDRLAAQARSGSEYLVGDSVSAADLYLANFIGMLHPLSEAQNPMPAYLRKLYSGTTAAVEELLADRLLAYRDRVYARHIRTPLVF